VKVKHNISMIELILLNLIMKIDKIM